MADLGDFDEIADDISDDMRFVTRELNTLQGLITTVSAKVQLSNEQCIYSCRSLTFCTRNKEPGTSKVSVLGDAG